MELDPKPIFVATVIKADGTVPFEDDVHPTIRAHIIAQLVEKGHHVVPVPGTRHVRINGWIPGTPPTS